MRITSAISTQCYDHVEGSLKELVRLGSILNEARHGQNFTNALVDDYITEFLRLEDELTKQRRFAKKEEEKMKGKSKVLSGLHKSPLPIIKDSLDVIHWGRQVNELMKALNEEGDSPVLRPVMWKRKRWEADFFRGSGSGREAFESLLPFRFRFPSASTKLETPVKSMFIFYPLNHSFLLDNVA